MCVCVCAAVALKWRRPISLWLILGSVSVEREREKEMMTMKTMTRLLLLLLTSCCFFVCWCCKRLALKFCYHMGSVKRESSIKWVKEESHLERVEGSHNQYSSSTLPSALSANPSSSGAAKPSWSKEKYINEH